MRHIICGRLNESWACTVYAHCRKILMFILYNWFWFMFTKMLKKCLSCLKGKTFFFDVFGVQGNDRIWTWADTWRSSPEHVYLFKLRWSSLVRNQSRFKETMTFGRWCYGYGMVHMGIANCANKTHFWFLLSLLHWGLLNILGISRKVCRNLRENPKEKKIQINLKK